MKYILHGATNFGSSNFGDFIYGNEIYQMLKNMDDANEVQFFQLSDYFKEYLVNYQATRFSINKMDVLIYIPGGYFIQESCPKLKYTLFRVLRYMVIGFLACILKKKIVVIGVGAGPMPSVFFSKIVKMVTRKACCVTVRDEESKRTLENLDILNVKNFGDMILSFDLYNKRIETSQIRLLRDKIKGKKFILVHFNDSVQALEKFAIVVKEFVLRHRDYEIVVTSDSVLENEEKLFQMFQDIVKEHCYFFNYGNPYEFIELLNMASVLLTCKLHAGVVSCMLHKSVICSAIHPEKTGRFYEQINQTERFSALNSMSPSAIGDVLEKFYDIPIMIDDDIIDLAGQHKKEMIKNLLQGEMDEK